ncbi:MAG: hypothetical protein QJR02_07195 [Sinobacteraceae bacterium]|nr:hypothetical protein [Nevskiaceae bacterium]
MTTYRTTQAAPNRGMSRRPLASFDANPVGGIVLAAVNSLGPNYLLMDGATNYSAARYPALVAALAAGNLARSTFGTTREITNASGGLGSGFSSWGAGFGYNGNEIVDNFTSISPTCISSDGGNNWSELAPWITYNVNGAMDAQLHGANGIRIQINDASSRAYTQLPPYTSQRSSPVLPIAPNINAVAADRLGNVLYAAAYNQIYLSTDDLLTVGTLQAAAGSAGNVRGLAWTGAYWVAVVDTGTVFKIFRSNSPGTSWTDVTPGTVWTRDTTSVAVRSDGNGLVVALHLAGKTLVSTDHGATWTGLNTAFSGGGNAQGLFFLWTGKYFWMLDKGLWSTDGVTWTASPSPPTITGSLKAVWRDPQVGVFALYSGASGGLVIYPFDTTFFQLVPPLDWTSRLPARYFVRAW